jgi:hypothetical protein
MTFNSGRRIAGKSKEEVIREAVDDPNFDRKLDLITEGCRPFVKEHGLTKISRESSITIINYILASHCQCSSSSSLASGITASYNHPNCP